MTPKNIHKIFIPKKYYFFRNPPKNIEIQNFEPKISPPPGFYSCRGSNDGNDGMCTFLCKNCVYDCQKSTHIFRKSFMTVTKGNPQTPYNSHQFFLPHQNLAKSHHLSSGAKDSKPL